MTSDINLLPCPFCGGEDIQWGERTVGTTLHSQSDEIFVFCYDCGAEHEDHELWNKRISKQGSKL